MKKEKVYFYYFIEESESEVDMSEQSPEDKTKKLSSSVVKARFVPSSVNTNVYETNNADASNEKALAVINRINDKLTGKDFIHESLNVPDQVQKLINMATSHVNLCQLYIGWCPFW